MAKYRNAKAGVLGLTFKGDATPRTVGPGEVFEAEAEEVPEHYLKQGWIVEAGKDERVGPPQIDEGEPLRTTADAPLTATGQPGDARTAPDAQRQQTDAQRAQTDAIRNQQTQTEPQPTDDRRHKR